MLFISATLNATLVSNPYERLYASLYLLQDVKLTIANVGEKEMHSPSSIPSCLSS